MLTLLVTWMAKVVSLCEVVARPLNVATPISPPSICSGPGTGEASGTITILEHRSTHTSGRPPAKTLLRVVGNSSPTSRKREGKR